MGIRTPKKPKINWKLDRSATDDADASCSGLRVVQSCILEILAIGMAAEAEKYEIPLAACSSNARLFGPLHRLQ